MQKLKLLNFASPMPTKKCQCLHQTLCVCASSPVIRSIQMALVPAALSLNEVTRSYMNVGICSYDLQSRIRVCVCIFI